MACLLQNSSGVSGSDEKQSESGDGCESEERHVEFKQMSTFWELVLVL